ncbi:protoglobin domain-containing protein [Acidithiobacillus thiooxidans]|uniref:protoglobin domain-containing protein n=1 Tax=Acidithiobacillus thiooxidans TaxID=930 RepID=UPI0004E1B0F2|nr:protoglobin domain-containing protein [Acidithiobacillus thiooxidans]
MTTTFAGLEGAATVAFSEQDSLRLKQLGTTLRPRLAQLTEDLYNHIQSQPETSNLPGDADQAARLRAMQKDWLEKLLAGPYDGAFGIPSGIWESGISS